MPPSSPAADPSPKKRLRLRASRWEVQTAAGDRVSATAQHPTLGRIDASVLDLSIHGARLALSHVSSNDVRLGDRLTSLVVRFDDQQVCNGSGTVVRFAQRGDVMELGIDLSDTAVHFDEVQRASARRSAKQRWNVALQNTRLAQIDPALREWVAQVESFLDTAQRFLDLEERELVSWDRATQEAVSGELLNAVTPDMMRQLDAAALELLALAARIPQEREPEHRAYVQSRLNRYLEQAPFIARAKQKPLGYAGDYEMMNMLYRDHREGATLFAKAINVWATQQTAAQANINRIEYIGAKIVSALEKKPEGRLRVASIGCGPAREVYAFLSRYPELGPRLDVALIDQDERALACCERSLGSLAARTGAFVRTIRHSVRRLLTDTELASTLGECDLIYSAGLFDYLAPRTFSALLSVLYRALASEGTLLIGNVADHNPDRAQMEYILEWYLYHRSPDELMQLASDLEPTPARVRIDAEPTGVNLFLIAER